MTELTIDVESLKREVVFASAKLTRASRIKAAAEKPMRERTAMDAALCALGRLIEDGWCT